MTSAALIGLLLAACLLGAVPFGLLLARLKGVDIRAVGSGNVGATNVFRAVSKPLGLLTFLLDALKGFVPAFFFPLALARAGGGAAPAWAGLAFGCAAVAGHTWPVYLRFRGGKGVATSAGMLVAVAPIAVGLALAAWIIVFALGRYVSLASIIATGVVVAVGWWRYRTPSVAVPVALTALGALIIWRHRANIARLRAGTENRFSFGGRKPAAGDAPGGADS